MYFESNKDAVRILLEFGADPTIRDLKDATPAHAAMSALDQCKVSAYTNILSVWSSVYHLFDRLQFV